MHKNTRNWIVGIIVVIVVLLLLWMAMGGTKKEPIETTNPPNSNEENSIDHNNENHNMTDSNESNEDNNLKSYREEQESIMADMMEKMKGIPQSGNASVDFLAGMIPHHESAIAMAESYFQYGGKNEELKQIATQIVETQTKEIEQMNQMIEEIKAEETIDAEKESAYLEEYNRMFTDHSNHGGSMTFAGNVEEAFAQGMIEHHQMAVDMAKAILEYTEYESIKTFAQEIITAQEKEIEEMNTILQNME